MSKSPVIITPKLIRRHNVRCFGRAIIWGLGAAAVFLIVFLFLWVLASLVTGSRSLTWPIGVGASVFGIAVFAAGRFYLNKHGPQDWERIAQKPERKAGMRLSRMSNQDYGQVGQGFLGLILAGPSWLGRISDEWRSVIPANQNKAHELEELRKHLAARDAWVPMRDFSNHEEAIYLLVKLDMLSIRELLGEWHFHVTVQGRREELEGFEL